MSRHRSARCRETSHRWACEGSPDA
jgi:hypothetical protein